MNYMGAIVMFEFEERQDATYFHTALGVLMAIGMAVIVWYVADWVMLALEYLRGQENDILQKIGRGLLSPAISAYVGSRIILKWLKRASPKGLFWTLVVLSMFGFLFTLGGAVLLAAAGDSYAAQGFYSCLFPLSMGVGFFFGTQAD